MRISFKIFIILIQFCCSFINLNESAKILAVFPFPGRSQYILVQPFLKTLAERGHKLTVINAYPGKENIENYRDVAVLEIHKIQECKIYKEINLYDNFVNKINFQFL